ncbi:SDR family oxidoreductase [Celeribacter arenosi]|uniref:NAD(P)H-binding protein n=1 Tax=Celeribacter arenosi TaxID=792649 RepID=A0ABP7JWI9_9RHOB
MKVIVIGATGQIGEIATRQLLEDGHTVTAFARRPQRVESGHESLSLFAGDAFDAKTVEEAVAGHDAVVVTLGSGKSLTSKIRSRGTLNVIRAMHRHGVKRLIVQSTLGAHESHVLLNFYWKRVMFGLILKRVFQDHELQEQLVWASGLDWTIVRPSAFADGPATGQYIENVATDAKRLKLRIARADIAAFLSRMVTDFTYNGRSVGITT